MKSKQWLMALFLLPAFNAFAAAQVEERALKVDAVESTQQKAEFTRNRAIEADQQLRVAELELAEAERAEQEARQRAGAAAKRVEEARESLSRARAERKAAREISDRTVEESAREWSQRNRMQ